MLDCREVFVGLLRARGWRRCPFPCCTETPPPPRCCLTGRLPTQRSLNPRSLHSCPLLQEPFYRDYISTPLGPMFEAAGLKCGMKVRGAEGRWDAEGRLGRQHCACPSAISGFSGESRRHGLPVGAWLWWHHSGRLACFNARHQAHLR